jgi:signal transduction histidine kinase
MPNLVARLLEVSPRSRLAIGGLAVVGIGVLDYLTGYEASLGIFYLMPVALLAWSDGKAVGSLLALGSAGAWLLADLLAGQPYSHGLIPYWNAAVRFAVFASTALALAALRTAYASLQRQNAALEREIAARQRAQAELERRREVERLSYRLLEVQERERRRLAQALREEVAQLLTAVKWPLEAGLLGRDLAGVPQLMEHGLGAIQEAIHQISMLALDLRPAALDDIGLAAALHGYAQHHAQQAGWRMELAIDPAIRVGPEIETACFRIVQEALSNVRQHAQAASVQLEVQQQAEALELRIHDDGRGFDVRAALAHAVLGEHRGLLKMYGHAILVGGTLEISSARAQGTEVLARLPLSVPADHLDQIAL